MHKVLQHLLKKFATSKKKNPAATPWGAQCNMESREKLKPLAVDHCLCKLPVAALTTMSAT
jgi:hypothetical protein